ncbi:unnamed protein product [Allacma fusca]|uniref:Uncharacterized protein n=1 Tax=Allacma fusca TaxID=39272 RepID=A0A8J2KJJ6_9HEXA|nr:unnamed protein product [Allacma fusca]
MKLDILQKQWKFFIAVFSPILLLLLPYYWKGTTGKEPYAAYVISLMAVYWMTECLPLAITSLLPIALFPIFGIVSSDDLATVYMKDSILFLLSGVVIALAVEYSNLHTRIAVRVILFIGAKIPRLLFGIMMTTMFLSMWMNNTSTTAMMAPIVLAIIEQLRSKMISQMSLDDTTAKTIDKDAISEMEMVDYKDEETQDVAQMKENSDKLILDEINENIRNLKVMFLIATAYSSNIGGTGVLTGSATNIVALDLVRKDADESYCPAECKEIMEIGFLHWMLFNAPPMILNTLVTWVYLQIHFLGIPPSWKFWQRKGDKENIKSVYTMEPSLEKSVMSALRQKYEELGPINFHEIGVLSIFTITVLLWIFKDPQFMPGWDSIPIFKRTATGRSFIKECTPTLLMCTLLFMIPKDIQYYRNFTRGGMGQGMKDTLLTWKFLNDKFPWGVFILLGGGNAISIGSSKSNLNNWIEEILKQSETLQAFPAPVLLVLMLCMITALTTLASNIATAAIITPVLLKLSYVKDLHPLYMALPAATVCSYAFMLPVSTAPNAIAYNAAPEMKLEHMVKAGFAVNVLSIVVLLATTHTVGDWVFGIGNYQLECSNMTLLST